MRLEGIIKNVGPMVEQPTKNKQTFKKMSLWVEETTAAYPASAVFQLKNDIAVTFAGHVGDYAIVDFNLKTFTTPGGVICNCLDAWRVKTITNTITNNQK